MKPKKLTPTKNKAQAMVEFAIALPILLMLLYGLLETGRLLFTYSSVVNATRQAVRWGSTTGVGDDGVTSRYKDCAGIKASAQRGDYLNVFNDADITITYDSGPGTSSLGACPVNITGNDKRIKVSINYSFKAIVPKLVPFVTRTINATSARTIITSISISNATATPSSTPSPTFTATFTPSNTPTKTSTPTIGPSPTNTRTFTPGPPPTQTSTATLAPASCAVNYTPNSWSNGFTADVVITNNSSTPITGWTLAWNFTAGQVITNLWNANYTQSGGAVTATNLSWNATINASGGTQSFGFQGTHTGSNPSPASFTLNGQPCTGGAVPATATLTPSLTPTTIPTGVSCTQLTHGPITYSGSTMSMVINNATGVSLAVQNVTVTWNHDNGQQGNKPLTLNNSALNSAIYWTGTVNSASYTITPSSSVNIPTGSSTITFKFNFNYFNQDGTERIFINISTPGCGFLDSNT